MKIMGLSDWAYWSSWFVTSYASLLLVSFLVSLIGLFPFRYTDWTVMFLFLALWTAQLVIFCFSLTTLFSSGKIASICGAFVYIVTWVPAVAAVTSTPRGSNAWLGACVMMPAGGIYMWGWVVSILENAQEGVQWANLSVNLFDGDKYTGEQSGIFSGGLVMAITVVNTLVYAGLAWYLDQVIPGTYGRPQPPWFLFLPSYWRSTGSKGDDWRKKIPQPIGGERDLDLGLRHAAATAAAAAAKEDDAASLPGGVELEPLSAVRAPAMIRVNGLVKNFGKVTAVDGLRFTARRGQITALLGHNGAGKTTTISVLTGMLRQDGGSATIDGKDVERDMKQIRRSLGVCPQFDVLWPQLTVREHLFIYARFRGFPETGIEAEVEAKIASVGLTSKAGCQAGTLSGGQKRKLSVAIAFIGDPAVVILDEPTSGMDPQSRRFTWDVIRSFKAEKGISILLTTHFMDEADILSDRVAIMSKGKLACVGSPLFLKTKFGMGYHLTLVLNPGGGEASGHHSHPPLVSTITDLVLGGIEGASLTSHSSSMVVYSLPEDQRASFPRVLTALESRARELGVGSCGVSCSTLEEVFLNVAELVAASTASASMAPVPAVAVAGAAAAAAATAAALAAPDAAVAAVENVVVDLKTPPPLRHGYALYAQQYQAMLRKRMLHARRDSLSLVTMYLVPILFVVMGLGVSSITYSAAADPPPAVMDRSYLGDLPTAFTSPDRTVVDPELLLAATGDVMGYYPTEDLTPMTWRGVREMWTCWDPSPVLDTCQPDSQRCDNCTDVSKLPQTLDGFLLAHSVQERATCRRGTARFPSCSALYAGSSRLDAADRYFNYTMAVSPTAYHALPASMTSFHSAVFAALHPGDPGVSLRAVNHPFPTTSDEKEDQAIPMQLMSSLCVVLGLACLSASLSVFLVWERTSASKHLQMVSGLHRGVFWAGVYTWDLMASVLPLTLVFLVFACSGVVAYDGEALMVIAATLALFAVSAPPLAYVMHWPFENSMACLAGQMGVYFFFGVGQLIAAVVFDTLGSAGVTSAKSVW